MKIFITPLDWGLGHATRIIPIVRKCKEQGHDVWIGGSGSSGRLLKEEFPTLKYIHLPGYNVKFSRYNSQIFAILFQLPLFFYSLIREHFSIKRLMRRHRFELIISDNRYTIRSKEAYNVFITHQLNVIFPKPVKAFGACFHFFQHKMIKKFDEVWIPDEKNRMNISGVLSEITKHQGKIYEIGLLSRFSKTSVSDKKNTRYDLLIILSGPEPQRSVLENKLFQQLTGSSLNILLVRGTFQQLKIESSTFKIYSYMDSKTLEETMRLSDLILCRSGYSSIMDLVRLGKQAILIPTPGQTEQEYLAGWLTEKGYFYSVSQDKIQIQKDIRDALKYYPPKESYSMNLGKRLNQITDIRFNKV